MKKIIDQSHVKLPFICISWVNFFYQRKIFTQFCYQFLMAYLSLNIILFKNDCFSYLYTKKNYYTWYSCLGQGWTFIGLFIQIGDFILSLEKLNECRTHTQVNQIKYLYFFLNINLSWIFCIIHNIILNFNIDFIFSL